MPSSQAKTREKAFRMRVGRKGFSEVGRALGVSPKTITRWEKGWVDKAGRIRPGWLARLEQVWREVAEADIQHSLMEREERLNVCEELARMMLNRIREMVPKVRVKTAADAKALLSEARELLRVISQERNEHRPAPNTVVAVKTDISLGELQERYAAAKAREAEFKTFQPVPQSGVSQKAGQEGEANDGSDSKEGSGAEGSPGVADDN